MAHTKQAGYGQPPRSGQFQKGRSGNPKGRPKKAMPEPFTGDNPTERYLDLELHKNITARTAHGETTLPVNQALIQKLAAIALGGSRLAIRDLMRMAQKMEAEEAARAKATSDYLAELKVAHQALLDKHEASGEAPKQRILPHPADIVLNRKTYRYELVGPFDEEDFRKFELYIELRKMLVARTTYEGRYLGAKPMATEAGVSCDVFAMMLNREFPPSLRWSEAQWLSELMKYDQMNKKQLVTGMRGPANMRRLLGGAHKRDGC